MTIKLSGSARDYLMNIFNSNLGQTGVCKIYTGAQPANADAAATGTLLASVVMDGMWDAVINGAVTVTESSSGNNAVASGVPGWARISTGSLTIPFDCSVGTSGADLIINSSPIVIGSPVQVVSFSMAFPTL